MPNMLLLLSAVACFLPPVIPAETFPASIPPQREGFNEFTFVVTSKMIFVPYVCSYRQNMPLSPSPGGEWKTT